VLMVSSQGNNELAVRARRAGAADCVDKNSPEFAQLAALARRALARPRRRAGGGLEVVHGPGKQAVVMIGADAPTWVAIEHHFQSHAAHLELEVMGTPAEFARRLAADAPVDAILIAPHGQAPNPIDLVRLALSHAPRVPVVVLAARSDAETVAAAFKLGVHDFLLQTAGYLPELVSSLNRALRPAGR
jgi:DNA-binding NtrC family response regulator